MDDALAILEAEPCDCGISWCEFFAAGYGDRGASFSRQELENAVREIREKLPLLEQRLKETSSNNPASPSSNGTDVKNHE